MIRIGIIGAGPNAAGHAKYFHQSPRTEVVAIADVDAARAGALAAESEAKPLNDYRDFLDKVDAVVVSSPNFLHRDQAILVAESGKHVYCEKPMGLSLEEARDIANAVNAANVKSQVGFSVRFDSAIQTMQRLQREGELGDIISLASRRLCYMNPAASGWRSDHDLSGGLLLEINIHEIDWMMAIGGEVQSVYARTWAANPTGERSNDHIWVTLNFAGGAVGSHEGSWLSSTSQFYRNAQGTKAGAHTNEWGNELYFAQGGGNRESIVTDPGFDLRGNFLDSIEGQAEAVADVNNALKVMTVAEAIFQSAAKNEVIYIDTL